MQMQPSLASSALEPVLLDADLPPLAVRLPAAEAAYMQRLTRVQVYAKLLINGHLVGTSQARNLQQDFTVDFADAFRWGFAADNVTRHCV